MFIQMAPKWSLCIEPMDTAMRLGALLSMSMISSSSSVSSRPRICASAIWLLALGKMR